MKKRSISIVFSKGSAFITLFGVLCLFVPSIYATDGPMYETTENMLSEKSETAAVFFR